jgi:hypothetical protein
MPELTAPEDLRSGAGGVGLVQFYTADPSRTGVSLIGAGTLGVRFTPGKIWPTTRPVGPNLRFTSVTERQSVSAAPLDRDLEV